MKIKRRILPQFIIVGIAVLLLGTIFFSVAQASPPFQDPRPPIDLGGSSGDNGGDNNGLSRLECASVVGQVINWGFSGQEGVGIELKAGSWRTDTLSSSSGDYGLGRLGEGVAVLHVALAPGEPLRPLIQDAGVYLSCDFPIVANIALFSGERIEPPAHIEMSSSDDVLIPGSETEITLTIENDLPTGISNVVVTNLMPSGLTALAVDTSVGSEGAQIITNPEEGQLIVVNLDKLDTGAEVTIEITVVADANLPRGVEVRNTATLFYRESASDQDWIDFTVGSNQLPIPAASATTTDAGEDVAPSKSDDTTDEEFVPPAEVPKTGEDFFSLSSVSKINDNAVLSDEISMSDDNFIAPNNMPATGGDLTAVDDTVSRSDDPILVNKLSPIHGKGFDLSNNGLSQDNTSTLANETFAIGNKSILVGPDITHNGQPMTQSPDSLLGKHTLKEWFEGDDLNASSSDNIPTIDDVSNSTTGATDNASESGMLPVTTISAIVILGVLGLGGLSFLNHRQRLPYQNQD